ncbi:MAG: ATP-binding protein [Nitrososphaerota archaeon]|nr:ATP-binding protein [Nitrososphaerota archaeon]MDG6962007.1 ATP-binding protein [Nitrososphaerota archaeon]MDG6963012.1 ATP-binding protein [Nitrososphaerota archaeon]MDG6969673.1 ATP-binding protein [Nitrososphaerota archaeon]MDG6994230.1 ATP-binding protein [Nitrososphaerota archaeon]
MPGRLVLICGVPGSGKTTVARLVAAGSGRAVHLQTDAVRETIAKPEYSPEESEFVYGACLSLARSALDAGYDVVLDGTFRTRRRRESALAALAGRYDGVTLVHVVCDQETALRRNFGREKVVPPEKLAVIASVFEAPPGAVEVDTTRLTPEEGAELVLRALAYPLVPPE